MRQVFWGKENGATDGTKGITKIALNLTQWYLMQWIKSFSISKASLIIVKVGGEQN